MTVKYVEQLVNKAMDDIDIVQHKGNVDITYYSSDKTLRVSRFGTTVLVLDFDEYISYELGVVMFKVTSKPEANALNTVFKTLRAMGYTLPMIKFGYKPKNGGGYAQFLDGTEFK